MSVENFQIVPHLSTGRHGAMQLTGRSRRESPCLKGAVAKDAKTKGLSANNKLITRKERNEIEEAISEVNCSDGKKG